MFLDIPLERSRPSVMPVIALIVTLLASPAFAEPTPLKLPIDKRPVAARIGDYAMVAVTTARAYEAWHDADRKGAFVEMACEAAVAMGSIELMKRAFHRPRPDGSDNKSFPSGHTGYATAMSGWQIGAVVAVSRQMAAKHYLTDTLGGLLTGYFATKVCR